MKEEARDKAVEVFDELIGRYGDDRSPQIHETVGRAMFEKAETLKELNRLEEAAQAFGKMSQRHIDDPSPRIRGLVAQALLHQATLLGELEGDEEAAAAYEEVIDHFADDPSLYVKALVAVALTQKGFCLRTQPDLAVRDLERRHLYEELASEDPEEHTEPLAKARIAYAQFKIAAATALFEDALKLEDEGRPHEAVAAYEQLDARFCHRQSDPVRRLLAKALLNRARILNNRDR